MPYIPQDRRAAVLDYGADTAGELNFLVTHAIVEFTGGRSTKKEFAQALQTAVQDYVTSFSPLTYQVLNDVLGALFGATLEYLRRVDSPTRAVVKAISDLAHAVYTEVAVPYEEEKRQLNGDVYTHGA